MHLNFSGWERRVAYNRGVAEFLPLSDAGSLLSSLLFIEPLALPLPLARGLWYFEHWTMCLQFAATTFSAAVSACLVTFELLLSGLGLPRPGRPEHTPAENQPTPQKGHQKGAKTKPTKPHPEGKPRTQGNPKGSASGQPQREWECTRSVQRRGLVQTCARFAGGCVLSCFYFVMANLAELSRAELWALLPKAAEVLAFMFDSEADVRTCLQRLGVAPPVPERCVQALLLLQQQTGEQAARIRKCKVLPAQAPKPLCFHWH
eukprot:s1903_g15.t1